MSDSYSSSSAPAPRAPVDRTLSARTSNAQPRRGLSDADAPTGEAKFLAKNKRKKVRAAERNLKKAGFNPGKVDGELRPRTREALATFQQAVGLPATGELDGRTSKRLKNTANRVRKHDGDQMAPGMRSPRIKNAEKNLRKLGYDPGKVDGVYTQKTADAVRHFKRDQNALDNTTPVLGQNARQHLNREAKALSHSPWRRRVKDTRAQRRANRRVEKAAKRVHADGSVGLARGATNGAAVKTVQEHLRAAGYNPKRADGVFDDRTEGALKMFQRRSGLDASGVVDRRTWNKLQRSEMEANNATSPRQRKGERSRAVRRTEKKLKELGLNPGKVDGLYTDATQRAVDRFRKKKGLGGKGKGVDARTLRRIKKAVRKKNAVNLNTVKGCARALLKSKNVSFWPGLSTGSDESALRQLAKTGRAYVPVTGQTVKPKLNLMQALVEMSKKGRVQVNALTGGTHSTNSNHYRGTAVDLDVNVGSPSQIEAIANKHGGYRNFETTHIHLDF